MYIGWWSAGVTSAVACKFLIETYGADNVRLIYFKIGTAHEDNDRFKRECEQWYGKEIEVAGSPKYKDQFDVIEDVRWINGPGGARCTTELKKNVRLKIERETDYDGQCFGFEYTLKEINRALRFQDQYPDALAIFPLIERGMDKPACLHYLESNGIKRPAMYSLGYPNNNCKGCVKGGMGYWNKIRVDFPDIFQQMVDAEEDIGASCINGVYLKDLDPERGRDLEVIMPDCGSFCEIKFTDVPHPLINDVVNIPFLVRNPNPWLTLPDGESFQIQRAMIPYLGSPIESNIDLVIYDGSVILTGEKPL